jgi:hypothetical protein
VEEVTGEPLYRDRVCGIGIGKAGLVATIPVPSGQELARRAAETRSFGTTQREVLPLADGCTPARLVNRLLYDRDSARLLSGHGLGRALSSPRRSPRSPGWPTVAPPARERSQRASAAARVAASRIRATSEDSAK